MRCVTMVEEDGCNHADAMMARVTADLLVRHLLAGGYIIMKKVGAVDGPRNHVKRRPIASRTPD